MEQSGALHWLREANQNIAEAVKDVKHVQRNLVRYVNSDNTEIRSAYNRLRVCIGSIIREIEDLRQTDMESHDPLSLDELNAVVTAVNAELNEELSNLIREGRITPEMGTSLLNDSNYAHDVSLNLIKASQTLFVVPESEPTEDSLEPALADAAG